jgi:DNA-binding CsgD family transcriptional regulator
MFANPDQPERRDHSRRLEDHSSDYLHKTFSTPYCHSCLERIADGVLLLDNDTRVIFATPYVHQIMKKQGVPFLLSPKFTLRHQHQAARFASFVNQKNQDGGLLSLLLEGENQELLLVKCYQFPKPPVPDLQTARYMITLCNPNHCTVQQWQLFKKQFNLTQAEERLCRSFADGLTLVDYAKKWNVTTGTARSQLHAVFGKTATKRQSDLLRLIFMFSRS